MLKRKGKEDMKTEEDEAWEELERRQNARLKKPVDDDDTMVYRNELLEEVAKVIEQFKIPFAADTVASFAALVREMKR
jgi:hypothetical protein